MSHKDIKRQEIPERSMKDGNRSGGGDCAHVT